MGRVWYTVHTMIGTFGRKRVYAFKSGSSYLALGQVQPWWWLCIVYERDCMCVRRTIKARWGMYPRGGRACVWERPRLKSTVWSQPLIINKWAGTQAIAHTHTHTASPEDEGGWPIRAQFGCLLGQEGCEHDCGLALSLAQTKNKKEKPLDENYVRFWRVCLLVIWVCIVLRFRWRSSSCSIETQKGRYGAQTHY